MRVPNPQLDLFVSFLQDVHLRDQQDLMERPFFSLSKNKRVAPIDYVSPDGSVTVKVRPHQDYGMASIWDADILIWAASVLNREKKNGCNQPSQTLKVPPYELLTAIGRDPGGKNVERLHSALLRLKSTMIETTIRPDEGRDKAYFSWIDSGSTFIPRKRTTPAHVRITLSKWFYDSVLDDKIRLLTIDPAYFSITGGRERWLYRVARKHAGGNGEKGYPLEFPTLFEKSGAEGTYRRFKFEILKIVERNELPGYNLALQYGHKPEPTLHMTRRGNEPADTAPEAKETRTLRPALTDDALAIGRRMRPGSDIYALKADFDRSLEGKPDPDDYQRAFCAFVSASRPAA